MSIQLSDEMLRSDSLGAAVIAASGVPLLLLDEELGVVLASRSFGDAFHIDVAHVSGRQLGELGSGEWGADRLRTRLFAALTAGAPAEAYEIDLIPKGRSNRRLRIDAQPIETPEGGRQLLVALTDLTGIIARERLDQARLDEKDVMLQELQHRIANSLQIIASVLMQSAQRVDSDETRGHLHDAHSRVLSVAAVQSHLAKTRTGEVKLRAYFTDLCRSIGASMIHDPGQISLEVLVDDSATDADTSMSLGLIVTELVINSLKHAFPDHRRGTIKVDYRATVEGWTLSINDDGVGLPAKSGLVSAGLGTSIVYALTRKLKAQVRTSFGAPGTNVSIVS